jgi:hypothetical protein
VVGEDQRQVIADLCARSKHGEIFSSSVAQSIPHQARWPVEAGSSFPEVRAKR